MELLIVALALFIGLVGCWFVLPGETSPREAYREAEAAGPASLEQLA